MNRDLCSLVREKTNKRAETSRDARGGRKGIVTKTAWSLFETRGLSFAKAGDVSIQSAPNGGRRGEECRDGLSKSLSGWRLSWKTIIVAAAVLFYPNWKHIIIRVNIEYFTSFAATTACSKSLSRLSRLGSAQRGLIETKSDYANDDQSFQLSSSPSPSHSRRDEMR